ncbi:MAG TPA: hypothetical protein VG435_13210 [Acidimicrobiales bacterium]|nr:hypothetical protein [Acidimicrobiales bacterium]
MERIPLRNLGFVVGCATAVIVVGGCTTEKADRQAVGVAKVASVSRTARPLPAPVYSELRRSVLHTTIENDPVCRASRSEYGVTVSPITASTALTSTNLASGSAAITEDLAALPAGVLTTATEITAYPALVSSFERRIRYRHRHNCLEGSADVDNRIQRHCDQPGLGRCAAYLPDHDVGEHVVIR